METPRDCDAERSHKVRESPSPIRKQRPRLFMGAESRYLHASVAIRRADDLFYPGYPKSLQTRGFFLPSKAVLKNRMSLPCCNKCCDGQK